MANLKFEIVETLGVLAESGQFTKEVNMVKWGANDAILDIRKWKNDEEKQPLKGTTLNHEEAQELLKVLKAKLEA